MTLKWENRCTQDKPVKVSLCHYESDKE